MIIECPNCESRVDGKILSSVTSFNDEEGVPSLYSFIECPSCKNPIVGYQEMEHMGPGPDKWDFGEVTRMWPEPKEYLDYSLPELFRASLEEADKCYKAKAYLACAVMCGRALESVCSEYKTKSKTFAGGLKELQERKIIDGRLFDWSEALRKYRNIGAHASDGKINQQDAKDLVEFSKSIGQYVFVLTTKFEDFMKRTKKLDK